jgi:hypothetical protein
MLEAEDAPGSCRGTFTLACGVSILGLDIPIIISYEKTK